MGPENQTGTAETLHVMQPIAADVMSSRTGTCSTFSTLIEAALIFKDEGRGVVPVVEEGKAKGIVTARNIAMAISNHTDLSSVPVSEVMTTDVTQIPNDTPIEQVVSAFLNEGIRHLIVVDDQGDYVGVIGWPDLLPYLVYRPVATTPASEE